VVKVSAYTIIALIILVATGGLIAWLGDIIGYRLGKRRSSLFGLRPRTTARLVGMAVGATLPLIGLVNIQHLRDQQRSLSVQVEDLHRAATDARSEAEQAQQQTATLKDEAQTLHEQATTLRQRITTLQALCRLSETSYWLRLKLSNMIYKRPNRSWSSQRPSCPKCARRTWRSSSSEKDSRRRLIRWKAD